MFAQKRYVPCSLRVFSVKISSLIAAMLQSQMVTSAAQFPSVSLCSAINRNSFYFFSAFYFSLVKPEMLLSSRGAAAPTEEQHPQQAAANKLLNYKYCRQPEKLCAARKLSPELPRRSEAVREKYAPATVMQISKKNCMPNVVCVVAAKSNVYNLSRKQATDTCSSSSGSSSHSNCNCRQISCSFSFLFAISLLLQNLYTRLPQQQKRKKK